MLPVMLASVTLVIGGGFTLLARQTDGESIVPPGFATSAQSALYDRMSSRLIAPCCWAEAVRLHQSSAASRVRKELIADIRSGMDQTEIQDRFAREYGERILGEPRGVRTVLAYAIPALSCLIGAVVMGAFLVARQKHRPQVARSAADVAGLPEVPELE